MLKPLIGLTCHTVAGTIPRSSVSQSYVDAIVAAGGAPVAIPIGLDAEALAAVYGILHGLLLPGGDDVAPELYGEQPHPKLGLVDDNRDELELAISRWALREDMPVLGICRGIQLLAVAAGGTLYQDLPSQRASTVGHDMREHARDRLSHRIDIVPDSKLALALGTTDVGVNTFHHQAIRDVPQGYAVTARSEDGIIEGIESISNRYVVGVQCHPEGLWRTTEPRFKALFQQFVEASATYALRSSARQSNTA